MGKPEPRYEFGGPVGAFATMVSLPAVILFLYLACGKEVHVKGADLTGIANISVPPPAELLSAEAFAVCLGWVAFLVLLERVLPGKVVEGVRLPQQEGHPHHLEYKLNGHLTFWVATLSAVLFFDLTYLYDRYLQLAVAATVISVLLSVYLFVSSFAKGRMLAEGVTGNPVYDFFIGRELNPRVGDFDLKVFCELRPGMIGWMVLNLGMLFKQHQLLGYNTYSMYLVVASQGLYIWDSLFMERAILTTMDVTSDGFGFMLAFGDLAWVPFTYTLQARYLVDNDPHLSGATVAAIAVLCNVVGYVVFRLSNLEKDTFRRDPDSPQAARLKTMPTNNPSKKLLISGWWGLARKINYTGDWLNGLGWSLATGFGSIVPYFYPIYFAILLVHRAGRDDDMCRRKYGDEVWEKYRKKVPYMFVPGVF